LSKKYTIELIFGRNFNVIICCDIIQTFFTKLMGENERTRVYDRGSA
jgi:hypothetical protein